MTITTTEYSSFQEAFDFFNRELFGGKLPPCLITLQRKKGTVSYYSPRRFKNRLNKGEWTDEIALNPAEFEGRTDAEILSALVHEMVHFFQRLYGTPGRVRYHNREWADLMIERGLIPLSAAGSGGRQTGDKVSHYIKEGGQFQQACQRLFASGFKLNWQSVENWTYPRARAGRIEKEDKSENKRAKFTCPKCNQNAWAKPGALLICGVCYQEGQTIRMRDFWDAAFDDWTTEELATLT